MTSTKFSFDTIENFDEHIAQSIPNYHSLADSIRSVAPYFLKKHTALVDLGCSTGAIIKSIPHTGAKVGLDISEHLLPTEGDGASFYQNDITDDEPFLKSSLVLSIFTFQFIEQAKRPDLMQKVYNALIPDGAFIWAEKVLAKDAFWERTFSHSYYDFKRRSFTADEILDKEQDLRSMMYPNTSGQNIVLLRNAGFKSQELLWKNYNFECYIAIK